MKRCPLGTCERCDALARKEHDAKCPNRTEPMFTPVTVLSGIILALAILLSLT